MSLLVAPVREELIDTLCKRADALMASARIVLGLNERSRVRGERESTKANSPSHSSRPDADQNSSTRVDCRETGTSLKGW